MLEPPTAISEASLLACLHAEYGLQVASLAFLPLGADLGSAVYRTTTTGGSAYFAKVRFGPFDEMAALLPAWLAKQGIPEIIAPLSTLSAGPFASTPDFTVLVYPFIEGHDAYEGVLSDEQWVAFGRAVRQVHDAPLPPELAERVPREQYDPKWRLSLWNTLEKLDVTLCEDPIARRFVVFMAEHRGQLVDLLDRTDRLAAALQAEGLPFVLCHTDLHPGNLLVCSDGRFYIVDWDAPLLAPRARDLMYPGGAQGFPGRSPEEEESLFYRGYGEAAVDVRAVAYYRLERIMEDLAVISDQLLGQVDDVAGSGVADREQALGWAMSNFEPGHTLEIADRTERRARPWQQAR